MTRIVSVWLQRWPVRRFLKEQSRNPSPAEPVEPERPFVLTRDASGGPVIAAVSEAAAEAGLAIGNRVANARARAEGLQVRPIDPQADEAALHRLARWTMRYSPSVAPWQEENPDGFFIDITGASHLFGGEEKLIADLYRRLQSFGLQARLAIADTAGAASALSRFGPDPMIVLPSGKEAEALAPLPIEALRLAPETCATMRRLGFKRIGAFADKARAPFAARFEKELLLRLDQAVGRAAEPLSFIAPLPVYSSLRQLLEPIVTHEAIIQVTQRLMGDLEPELCRDGMGARKLKLDLFRVDGEVLSIEIGTALPTRDPKHIARLAGLKLDRLQVMDETGFGFESLRLTVLANERVEARQKDLTAAFENSAEAEANLLDAIGERIGRNRIRRFRAVESYLPEKAEVLGAAAGAWPKPCETRLRPVFLFARAEAADVMALVPEGPPKRFRWRGVTHGVAHAEGPERIADEWWRSPNPMPARDYYLVEDENGRRFWLYREGLYGEEAQPKWFVHGLFP